MSATPYYELPIFGAHDPVDLLVTYNTAMGIVDNQLKLNELASIAAGNSASTAISRADTAQSAADSAARAASAAQLSADAAQDAADLAQETADDARESADNAQQTADECMDAIGVLADWTFFPDAEHDDDVDVDMLANLKVDSHGIVYYIPTV